MTAELTRSGPEHASAALPEAMPLLDGRAHFHAMQRAQSPRRIRQLSQGMLLACALTFLGLAFLPWRQFIQGTGRVVAYNPLERSLTVEAPLAGRVDETTVREGQVVKQGDVLFELVDNDPNLLANLEQQREFAKVRRKAAGERVESLSAQIGELERSLPLAMEAAETRLDAARFAATTAGQQFTRIKSLFDDRRGLSSQRDFELAQLERDRTVAELARAEAELKRVGVDLRAGLSSAAASRDSARADFAAADQALVALDIQVSQTQRQRVLAPRNGIVFRVQATEGTFLRAGSPLCTLIPETSERMVEVLLDGNDMPLIQAREMDAHGVVLKPGSPARVQFEGWPALQVIGWPSIAVGTFGGEVVVVDPTDNGKGKFRALIAPKPDVVTRSNGETQVRQWPDERWLRQGVRANGWVLLQQVPLWYELWRQMNGFPPVLTDEQIGGKK